MEAVSNNVEELLGFIEESRMQLMVTAQSARQKPPPKPSLLAAVSMMATNKRPASAAAKKSNEDAHQDTSGSGDWDMTSPMDMSVFEATTVRV